RPKTPTSTPTSKTPTTQISRETTIAKWSINNWHEHECDYYDRHMCTVYGGPYATCSGVRMHEGYCHCYSAAEYNSDNNKCELKSTTSGSISTTTDYLSWYYWHVHS